MKEKSVWSYDIETLINCFTVAFVNVKTDVAKTFVIWDTMDDSDSLFDFLQDEVKGLVSFNGIGFDRPVMGKIPYLSLMKPNEKAMTLYQNAQSIIVGETYVVKTIHDILEKIPELDLYLMYHFNNEARRTSLKWIQCHMGVSNIMEMPHPHDKPVTEYSQLAQILEYNVNDARTTAQFYNHPKTQSLISLRRWAKETYGIDKYNTSNAHMGEMIFLKNMGEIREPDTSPRVVKIKDLILPSIKFTSATFNQVLEKFKKVSFRTGGDPPEMSISTIFQGMRYDFGLGGLHAVRPNRMYDEHIDSIDVKSFYPRIAIHYKLRPSHLPESFTQVYSKLYDERAAAKDPVVNNGLKEALNSVFGKSNSIYSPLYDPSFTFSITVNGQLLMAMLAERIELAKAGSIIMVNTDGMEVLVRQRENYQAILNDWIKETGMIVSTSNYVRLMIRDVNNYIGINFGGKVKAKGVYEVSKDWTKDPSAAICAIAIEKKLVDNMPIENTIDFFLKNEMYKSFYMFKRAKTGYFKGVALNGIGEFDVQKTVRYLVTNTGFILYQITDAMKSKIHNDAYITMVNDLDDIQDTIEIDRQWYVKETRKMLIENPTSLF